MDAAAVDAAVGVAVDATIDAAAVDAAVGVAVNTVVCPVGAYAMIKSPLLTLFNIIGHSNHYSS